MINNSEKSPSTQKCKKTANRKGGGIYVAGGTFTIKGDSKVTVARNKNDVYLATGKTIEVDFTLSAHSVARITPESYVAGTQVISGKIASNNNYTRFSVTPERNGTEWGIGADGKLHKPVTITGGSASAWKTLRDAVLNAESNGIIIIDGTFQATNDSGNNGEISIKKPLIIRGKNGSNVDILDANALSRVMKVLAGNNLTLENLTVKNGKVIDDSGGGIRFAAGQSSSIINLKNCKIINNTVDYGTSAVIEFSGGGILVENSDITLTVSGCTIENNTIIGNGNNKNPTGAGIFLGNRAHTDIRDTTIKGNKITGTVGESKGGGIYMSGGTLFVEKKGNVADNDAVKGKQIYIRSGSFNGPNVIDDAF